MGMEVIKALGRIEHPFDIFAGIREVDKNKENLSEFNLIPERFDFTDASTFEASLNNCEILFLLRPPQLSNSEKYFQPLVETAKKCGVKHLVFLSVQGVDKSTLIPHHTIEKLIVESRIPYTFLRPAYFMQNFTTTLHDELVKKKRIFLPAGEAKFTLIDVRDVGEVAAKIIVNTSKHLNQSYDLTCSQKLTFQEMADKLSEGLGVKINYVSPNLVRFTWQKLRENVPFSYILVLIMLHYFPRFQREPFFSNAFQKITGKNPISFEQFVIDHKDLLLG